jgi:NADH oxidase (H2O2-forming)
MSHIKSDVVVLGGGPAGRVIVHALHQAPKSISCTLVKDEPNNVNRCAVPYGIEQDKGIEQFTIPNSLVTDFGATLLVDRVTHLDARAYELHTENGDVLSYGQLVLALGARPIMPPLPGIDALNVLAVRSLDDLRLLRKYGAEGKRAVIMGGGYIGVEVAVELRRLGLEVHLVEMLPSILSKTVEPEFVPLIAESLQQNGIHVHLGKAVESFGRDGDFATGVRLASGAQIEADFFVVAVGVQPNVELAHEAGVEVSKFGICVDEHMRTSVDNVYAAGDCAEKRSLVSGQLTRGEFGTNAVFMSKVVAANLLGKPAKFGGVLNANASTAFDWSFGSAGLIESEAKAAGYEVITGISEVLDKYPMMHGVEPVRTKLVFDAKTERLLGGTVLRKGHAVAGNIDFLSLALQMRATREDLLRYQYATHPELAAKPSDNAYVFAAKAAQ